jgi:arsenate reductase
LEEVRKSSNEVEVIEYLKKIPTVKELKLLLSKLNLKPLQIVRTSEKLFKEKFKGKNFTDEEWIQILHENPVLIERPIVVKNNKAILCRPPERVEEII